MCIAVASTLHFFCNKMFHVDVVTCVITMVCVITGKEKEKEEEGQKS